MKEVEARVKEVIPRTYNVKSFRLEMGGRVEFKAGQFLQVTLQDNPELKRYLSISNSPTEKGHLEFTKKITESDFSKTLNSLKPGDSVQIKYPLGNFILDGAYQKIAFISGGIGITPVRSICKYIVDRNMGTDVILLYANRTAKDIAFRQDFDEMQKQYLRLKVVHILSEPETPTDFETGRINQEMIKESITDYIERKFYLCGPPAMVEAMERILIEELALSQENIITENFQGY